MRTKFFLSSCVFLLLSAEAYSQVARDRAGSWEIGFNVIDMSSESLSGNSGSSLDVDDDIGWGFTGGYNFTNRLAFMVDVNWMTPDYEAVRVREDTGEVDRLRAELDVLTIHAKGVFYFLEGDLTPFIEAGVGWTEVDSNIIDGPPTTGCWWDPWWGYICTEFFDTYTETRTSFSAAFGLRWELSPDTVLKGSVGLLEIDTSRATEDASLDTIRIDFAWRF